MTPRFLAPVFCVLAACQPDESLVAYGADGVVWALSSVNGQAFEADATIAFLDDGLVKGHGPCNAFSTKQSAPYPWIELGPILSTKRACTDLEAETTFFAALPKMQFAEISGNLLILSNEAGQEMVFTARIDGSRDQ